VEIGTSAAARQFQTHPNVLLRLILLGRLTAHKNSDGHWLISEESLERWNRKRVRRAPKPERGSITAEVQHA
jgi:hypothetical protein